MAKLSSPGKLQEWPLALVIKPGWADATVTDRCKCLGAEKKYFRETCHGRILS
jgi:hypothetical protein